MNENFTDDLKKAIEEGFVILDEKNHYQSRRFVTPGRNVTPGLKFSMCIPKTANVGVDAAARFHSSLAGPIKLRNTLPPLASKDTTPLRLKGVP